MNISKIVSEAMCIGCGTCEAVCKYNAVLMDYKADGSLYAKLNQDRCTNCGMCLKCCPSSPQRNIGQTEEEFFYANLTNKAYLAWAVDEGFRAQAQSGGTISAILAYLADNENSGKYALCRYSRDKGMFESFLAQTKEDILDASGSNYIQLPHCKTIIENAEDISAAVLLGCQAEALDNYLKINKNVSIKYRLGLICVGVCKKTLLEEYFPEFKKDNVESFRFKDKRFGGGDTVVKTVNGTVYMFDNAKRKRAFKSYKCLRCMACNLKLNNKSDILFGDPWGVPVDDVNKGYTVAVLQTDAGEELFFAAKEAGYIDYKQISVNDVKNGQYMIQYRKNFFNVHHYLKSKKMLIPYTIPETFRCDFEMDRTICEDLQYAQELYNLDDQEKITKKIAAHKRTILRREQKSKRKYFFKRIYGKFGRIINKIKE